MSRALDRRLVLLGHEVAIEVDGDLQQSWDGDEVTETPGATCVYTAQDWSAATSATYGYDEDGDLRRVSADGRFYGPAIPVTRPTDPSKRAQLARRWARETGEAAS